MKRILIALMASMMVITTAACGNSGSASSEASESSAPSSSEVSSSEESSAPESSAPEGDASEAEGDMTAAAAATLPIPADATDEEKAYIEGLNKLLPELVKLQEVPAEVATDAEVAKKYAADMKAQFEALGALTAPEKYADVQAKFAEGGKAMAEYLDLQVQIMGLSPEELASEENAESVKTMAELGQAGVTAFQEALMMAATSDAAASADLTEAAADGEASGAESSAAQSSSTAESSAAESSSAAE